MRVRLALLISSLILCAPPTARDVSAATVASTWRELPADSTDSTDGWHDFEFGPTFSVPIPAEGASKDELGMNVGLSGTLRHDSHFGVGLDVAYHYWPVSGEFKKEFNQLLYEQTLSALQLGGTTWRLNVIQLTGHAKAAATIGRLVHASLQAGAGVYLVDPNTTGYSGDAGFFSIEAGPLKRSTELGFYLETGVDFRCGPHMSLGLVGTYHHVSSNYTFGSDLGIFSVGAHALFGR